jgi:hypothetical protein
MEVIRGIVLCCLLIRIQCCDGFHNEIKISGEVKQ